MANNIITNHTLEQYNKKYHNRRYRLLKITKKEVEDFDKKNPTKTKGYLLSGRKWWLIGDTYYEIPKALRYTWFRNLNGAVQVGCCLLGVGAITTAIVVPTVIGVKSCANNVSAELVDTEGAKIESSKYEGDHYIVMLKANDATKEVSEITSITIGNQTLVKDTDFTYDPITGKLSINKSVITANKNAKILIKAEVGPIKTRITITADKNVIPVKGTLQFSATVTPSSASSKTVKWGMVHDTNAGSGINEDTGLFNGAVAGTYKIQAHLADDETIKSNIFEVTVKTDVTNIELPATASGDVGGNVSLAVTVTPSDATVTYDWDIVDKTVVDWKTGEEHKSNTVILDGLKAGTTNVSVTVKDKSGHEMNATCAVTIKPAIHKTALIYKTGQSGDNSITYVGTPQASVDAGTQSLQINCCLALGSSSYTGTLYIYDNPSFTEPSLANSESKTGPMFYENYSFTINLSSINLNNYETLYVEAFIGS